jgi:AsmA protein
MSAEPSQPASSQIAKPAAGEAPGKPAPGQGKVRSFWRSLPMIAGVLLLLIVAGLAYLVIAPPTEFLKGELIRAVREATGRELTIRGRSKFTLYPKLGMELRTVSLSGPPDAAGADLLRAETVSAEIRLLSLIRGPVEISRIDIVRPSITLRPEDASLLTALGGKDASAGGHVVIQTVTISEGSMNYLVKQPNPEWHADQITATITGLSATGEARANGQFRWRHEPVTFAAILSDAGAVARGAASPLDLTVNSKHLVLSLKGEASGPEPPQVKGMLTATSGSLRDFLRWLDADPGPYALKGQASLEGMITATPGALRLERNSLKLAAGEGTIDAEITRKEPRVQITGAVAWRQLDLKQVIGEQPKMPALALQARAPQPGPTIPSGWEALAAQLTALGSGQQGLAAADAIPLSKSTPDAWNKQVFNFQPLSRIDANLTATADKVTYGPLEMRRSRSEVTLVDGRLSYAVKEAEIDKGRITGRFDVDSAIKPARVAASLSASEIAADSVLAAFLDTRLLAGKTKLDLVVSGRGQTGQDLVNTLEGTASVIVEKGEIVGFNLRRALLEWWQQWSFDPSQKTRFERLSARYGIKDGIMRSTDDLAVTGGEIEIKSSGTVALPSRTLDQRIKLQATPPPVHWPVPLRVGGTWSKPSISWDWLSVFKNPASLGALTTVAQSPVPVPKEVKLAIENLLKGPNAAELPEETRALLQSLAAEQ